MPNHLPTAQSDHGMQTVRTWRTLLALGLACALFVAVAILVAAPPTEPPLAVQVPAAPTLNALVSPGG